MALPEDDPESLDTLLHLVHANSTEAPGELSLAGIYKMVVFMDKYDTPRFMRPWKRDWLGKVKAESNSSSGPSLCMAVYVALQMGAESIAFTITSNMSRAAVIDEEDRITIRQVELYESVDAAGPHCVSGTTHLLWSAKKKQIVCGNTDLHRNDPKHAASSHPIRCRYHMGSH